MRGACRAVFQHHRVLYRHQRPDDCHAVRRRGVKSAKAHPAIPPFSFGYPAAGTACCAAFHKFGFFLRLQESIQHHPADFESEGIVSAHHPHGRNAVFPHDSAVACADIEIRAQERVEILHGFYVGGSGHVGVAVFQQDPAEFGAVLIQVGNLQQQAFQAQGSCQIAVELVIAQIFISK